MASEWPTVAAVCGRLAASAFRVDLRLVLLPCRAAMSVEFLLGTVMWPVRHCVIHAQSSIAGELPVRSQITALTTGLYVIAFCHRAATVGNLVGESVGRTGPRQRWAAATAA